MAKRAGNVNNEQKDILIEYLKKHPKMTEGKFTRDFTFKDSQKLWEDLSKLLNSVPNGGTKTWKQWRKVWQDLKTKTKSKKAQIKKHMGQTGGGAPTEEKLNDNDLTILEIVSETAIEGVKNIQETYVPLFSDMVSGEPVVILGEANHNTIMDNFYNNIDSTATQTADASISCSMENKNNIIEPIFSPSLHHTAIPTSRAEASTSFGSNNKNKTKRFKKYERTLTASENLITLTQKKLDMKQQYLNKKITIYEEHVQLMKHELEVKKEIANSLSNLVDLLKKKDT